MAKDSFTIRAFKAAWLADLVAVYVFEKSMDIFQFGIQRYQPCYVPRITDKHTNLTWYGHVDCSNF